jgi:hypothetical protein
MRPCHSFVISEGIWKLICKTANVLSSELPIRIHWCVGLKIASQLHSIQFPGILKDASLPLMLGNGLHRRHNQHTESYEDPQS